MTTDYAAIAAEVADAFADVGMEVALLRTTRTGPEYARGSGTTKAYPLTVLEDTQMTEPRDRSTTGNTTRTLSVSAAGDYVPTEEDSIWFGRAARWNQEAGEKIVAVRPYAPAGTPVLYEIDLD